MRISDWSSDVCSSDLSWLPPDDDRVGASAAGISPRRRGRETSRKDLQSPRFLLRVEILQIDQPESFGRLRVLKSLLERSRQVGPVRGRADRKSTRLNSSH